ncbi:MAG: hemolysin family protein [Actinomycetia bacterium]|nr:hemolysin family protein [Actinomycetes bacterium]MCH9706421.1 hemolysin family protein [Actinomycetes bacterium]MCH9788078.1 hemolysin family protein [Actinomycetes bacterium]MCH9796710.1 hemolysin family protein [Actinomycetes bacterium]MCH9850359.1 hemolysin family protein [Actinomycetes bacterium]
MNLWLVLIAIALIVASGLLIAAETAMTRVSKTRIDELRKEGNGNEKRAELLLGVLQDRARYVNVLFLLSTIATITSITLISYVAVRALTSGDGWSTWIALVVVIVALVVVAYIGLGVAPRTLGRQHAERIALIAARPTRFLATILGPITTLLIVIGNALTPGKGFREGPFDTAAELREMVDLAGADDLIEDAERKMIHSVFDLGDTFAREVMVPRTEMVFIERNKSLRQAISLSLRSGFSRIPVIGENADDIVGVIYLKDMVRRTFEHHEAEREDAVDSLMRATSFVPDSKPADELLKDMQAARVHVAIVVDEYGGTAGLVTIEDILEEIVGEIADEYDTAAPEVTQLDDDRYRVLSRMNLDDFAELTQMEINAEDEGVDTVLGFMAKRLGRVPIPGAEVVENGWSLVAERGAGRRNRIGAVLATRIATLDDGDEHDDE